MAAFLRSFRSKNTEDASAEEPVQILSVEKDQVVLNHVALNRTLGHPDVGKKPIAVITIVGGFRMGKSFVLNFILRYLRNKGYANRNWIGSYDEPLSGFSWRSSDDAVTHGIWMWSKPIIVTKAREEIAVFVVDTQGHFNVNETDASNWISVILSMLLSSVMIFNVKERVLESDVKFLETCIEYSELTNGEKENNMFDLQALNFLVRDRTSEKDYPHGSEGGRRYKDEMIFGCSKSASSPPMTRIREKLRSTFDSIDCYLMPHPGLKVTMETFSGCLRDVDNSFGFIEHLIKFCESIAHPENLVEKKNNFKGRQLMSFLIRNFEALERNKGKLLDPKSFVQIQQDTAVNESFMESSIDLGKKLEEILKHGHVPKKKFEEELKRIWEETCAEFRNTAISLGADPERQVDRLEKYVTLRHFKRCRSINKIAKLSSGNIAETALILTINYGEKMNEAMKAVHAHEWEQKLNTNHDDGASEAKTLFSELSKNREYKEGLGVLFTGIDCVKDLMQLEGPMKRDAAKHKWKKIIWESVQEYRMVWNQPPVRLNDFLLKLAAVVNRKPGDPAGKCTRVELHGIARQRALKHFDTNAAKDSNEEARNELIRLIKNIATQLQVENESGPTIDCVMHKNGYLIKIRDELRIFDHKKKVLKEVNEYSKCTQAVFHGSKFERILAKKRTKYAEGARQIEQTLTGSGTGPSLKEKVLNTVDAAFQAMKKRDASLEPFHDRILGLDIKMRRLAYLSFLGEKLDGAYVLPNVLDEMHRTILDEFLPKEDEDDEILHKHRNDVKRALDQQIKKFKVWNEENKSNFKRVIGSVAGGLGFASGGAAGGTAAGLFFADIAIVTTAGAAVATGIGAAIVAGVLIVGGSIAAYLILRKKAGNVHITEQMEKINSGQQDEDEQEDQEENDALHGQEDTETN